MIREKIKEVLFSIDGIQDDGEEITGLISKGYLDSFGVLVLIDRLEKTFKIKLEVGEELFVHLDSVASIEQFVKSRMEQVKSGENKMR